MKIFGILLIYFHFRCCYCCFFVVAVVVWREEFLSNCIDNCGDLATFDTLWPHRRVTQRYEDLHENQRIPAKKQYHYLRWTSFILGFDQYLIKISIIRQIHSMTQRWSCIDAVFDVHISLIFKLCCALLNGRRPFASESPAMVRYVRKTLR